MEKISIIEALRMKEFLEKNIRHPEIIAAEYHKHKGKYDALAKQYPMYKEYVSKLPRGVAEKLRTLGVPL